jgi:hypothetical protein
MQLDRHQPSLLLALPGELLEAVLVSLAQPASLAAVALVGVALGQAVRSESLWKDLYLARGPHVLPLQSSWRDLYREECHMHFDEPMPHDATLIPQTGVRSRTATHVDPTPRSRHF